MVVDRGRLFHSFQETFFWRVLVYPHSFDRMICTVVHVLLLKIAVLGSSNPERKQGLSVRSHKLHAETLKNNLLPFPRLALLPPSQ